MTTYSRFFAGKLGFKDEATAHHRVELIDRLHQRFAIAKDRTGQHHALVIALTMFDRARWTVQTYRSQHLSLVVTGATQRGGHQR